jgi:hypothetical protein
MRIVTKYSALGRRKYWTQNVFRFHPVWVAKVAFGMLGGRWENVSGGSPASDRPG